MRRMVWKLAILVGLFGLVTSRRQVLDWIAPMTSLDSLIVWYIAFGLFVMAAGFYIFNQVWTPKYTIAILLVTWALGIILYWPVSNYSTAITGAKLTGVESATEDAITYSFLQDLGIHDSTGILTYAVVPAILILVAGNIIAPQLFGKIFRSVLGRE